MGSDFRSSINDLEGVEFMVVDTGDIDLALVRKEDLGIIAENTAVGSPIDKRTTFAAFMDTDMVAQAGLDVRGK